MPNAVDMPDADRGGPVRPREGASREVRTGGLDQPVVRCAGITKYFGGVRALSEVSLDLRAGEVVGLVGDNGAGKSTLVKILSGIYRPDAGVIGLDDREVAYLTPQMARSQGIETVYQDLALCDNLTAAENVVLGQEPVRLRFLGLRIIDKRKSLDIARDRIKLIGIELDDFSSPVRRLSGGQRQAIAVARATVTGHRLLMLDEPTAALGVRQTEATLQLIRHVAGQGVAVVIITHNLDQIFAISDRIVALRLGEIKLDYPVEETSRREVVACMTGLEI